MEGARGAKFVPKFLRLPARMARNYLQRISLWRSIGREIVAADEKSRSSLRRSMIASPLTALPGLDHWRDPVLLEEITAHVPGIGVMTLRSHCDDLYHALPSREPEILHEIRSRLRPGDIFVDCGANIGVFTLVAGRRVGKDGHVIAVEMVSETAGMLRKHVEMNGLDNVTVIERAVSDRAGHIRASLKANQHGQASIVRVHGRTDGGGVDVVADTLDNILSSVPSVRLMKIDIEGAELLAFKGAENTLHKIEAIIFEQLPESDDCKEFLESRGFTVRSLMSKNFLATREA